MIFNNEEKNQLSKYLKSGEMYITDKNDTPVQLDCCLACNDCYFKGNCIIGGKEDSIREVTESVKEIRPEYFL